MDYSDNVFHTYLGLNGVNSLAVNGTVTSLKFSISSKISSFIFHHLALAAKFKVLMLAYKTTTGIAPIYLNSLVQTRAPLRCLRSLQVNDALWYIPKRHKITLTDLFLDCSQQVERPAYINPSSWILTNMERHFRPITWPINTSNKTKQNKKTLLCALC